MLSIGIFNLISGGLSIVVNGLRLIRYPSILFLNLFCTVPDTSLETELLLE